MDRTQTGWGEFVRLHRGRTGRTQRELAAQTGISIRALRDIEQGRSTPRARAVLALRAALDFNPETDTDESDADHQILSQGRPPLVGVLGPLEVHRDGGQIQLNSAMVRNLLGLLALQYGTSVSVDQIIDVLWGERPPRSCRNLVQIYVGQVRDLLEPGRERGTAGQLLHLDGRGYVLQLGAADLDLSRFADRYGRAGRAYANGDLPTAQRLYREALRCWRAPVLVGESCRLTQHPVAVGLAKRRLAATMAFANIALIGHRYGAAVAVLSELAADEALHEGLQARLILSLAGCGEQAAALHLYTEVRTRLADELGVQPGHELEQAHLTVLRQQLPPPDRSWRD